MLNEKSPRRSHLQANKESTHSGCSNSGTPSTFTTSNQTGEIHVFLTSSLDYVTSRNIYNAEIHVFMMIKINIH